MRLTGQAQSSSNLVRKISPPQWPWKVNQALANKGKVIFARKTEQGGCIECHGKKPGQTRFLNQKTWATPIMDVGTDPREYDVLGWTVKTGVLEGAKIPFVATPLKPLDTAFNVRGTSVIGSILQHYVPVLMKPEGQAQVKGVQSLFTPETESLKEAFIAPPPGAQPSYAYESRVLEGIWSAAPYLHNGSMPTLAELLKPAADRVSSFKVGPEYDIVNVGLAVDQTAVRLYIADNGLQRSQFRKQPLRP